MKDKTALSDGILRASSQQNSKSVARTDANGGVATTCMPRDSEDSTEETGSSVMVGFRYRGSLSMEEGKTLDCRLLNAVADATSMGSVRTSNTLMESCSEVTASAMCRNHPIELAAFCGHRPVRIQPRTPTPSGSSERPVAPPRTDRSAPQIADAWRLRPVRPV